MSRRGRGGVDPMERAIEQALLPGSFVSHRHCFSFVGDLEDVAAEVAGVVDGSPARAVALYEVFLAGCYEKSEEIDDSSGSFGAFVVSLVVGWVRSRQAAGADAGETVARLLAWMDDDPYGYCHRLDRDVAHVLDKAGRAGFIATIRERFDAALTSDEPGHGRDYERRRSAEILRTLYAAGKDVSAYIEFAERTEVTPADCLAVAAMLNARRKSEQALLWVDRGLELDLATPHGSIAGYELREFKPRLLTRLGRAEEALESAWTDFQLHPSAVAYDHLMTFVPKAERPAWQETAINAAMGATYLPSAVELLLHVKEVQRLAQLLAGVSTRRSKA